MTATWEHPTLKQHITPEQRSRAEGWLADAYADGRVSEDEFDQRIGQVLGATTRRDLNAAFYGLVQVPSTSQALGVHPAYQPLVHPEVRQQAGRGVAGAAHFSIFFFWILGPAAVYALSTRGTYARREAAKAFNFQLISFLSIIALAITAGVSNSDWLGAVVALAMTGWFVLTIVGGAKALQGEDWRNPVTRVIKLEALREEPVRESTWMPAR